MHELRNILAATRSGIVLTGTAAMGQLGQVIGNIDIGESDDSYMFLVSLPRVEKSGFVYAVKPNGKVNIKGLSTTGEKTVQMDSLLFEMQTQNLCPPGFFTISFQLPGPVDLQGFFCHLKNGVLEGTVMKRQTGEREKTVQTLCQPEHFSISLLLPGPVDPQELYGCFKADRIVEGIVMKRGRDGRVSS